MVLLVLGFVASGVMGIQEGVDYIFKTVLGYFGAQGLADAAGAIAPIFTKLKEP